MSKIPSMEELLKAGVHFGHNKSKWHPKMAPFIFTQKNKLHIINLEETHKMLEQACEYAKNTVANGGVVLFLGTKKQAQNVVKEAALSCNMPYVNQRWLGGTLTNSRSVLGLVKKFRKLKADRETGKFERYTKRERLVLERKIEKMEPVVGGMENLNNIPNALFIIDVKKDKTAVLEANRTKVPVIALCDTNVNPTRIAKVIPGNDDAVKSIKLITETIAAAINEGLAMQKEKSATAVEKK